MLICALIEVAVLLALAVVICWDKGISSWVGNFTGIFDRPVVKELDLS